jgi:alkanesulfonate monooxygenase SsuD/methylene tetrahydromethanopterin reductase-like flavin-dependent oxidoreductase (luciferase family)
VWWWYKNLAEFTLEWEFAHFSQADKDRLFPLLKHQASDDFNPKDFNDADMIIVGDPDQCLTKMLRYAELGVDQLICYVQFGYLPHESVTRTIELLGKHVIPELERRGVQTTVKAVPAGSGDGKPDLSQVVD